MEHGTDGTASRNNKGVACNKFRAFGPCTWNNYSPENLTWLEKNLGQIAEEFYINEEVGDEGTPHLQFCFRFKNPRSFKSVVGHFPGCHIEKSNNWPATKSYCCKKETAVGHKEGKKGKVARSIKDPLDGKTMRPFQEEIAGMMEEEPDDRTINWYYDLNGNIGKTTLAKHLCIKYPGKVLYMGGKAADIKYGVTSFLETETNELKIAIFDAPRTSEKFMSYEAIEAIKNGIFYNTKYESKMIVFDSPHVVVFSNFEPERSKLSNDRWRVIDLTVPPTGGPPTEDGGPTIEVH